MKKLKFIDLFCGIGGFHLGLNNFECVYACDIDPKCRFIYEQNFGIKPEGDIKKIPMFDILCAGFPCQPFSKAGFKKVLMMLGAIRFLIFVILLISTNQNILY